MMNGRKFALTLIVPLLSLSLPSVEAAVPTLSANVRLSPATRAHLLQAMGDESFAYAQYNTFAQAVSSQYPELANLWRDTANVELNDHFFTQAKLTGLVKVPISNLEDAANSERGAVRSYRQFAAEARASGDSAVADLFAHNAQDEARHLQQFEQAISALRGRGTIPVATPAQQMSLAAAKTKPGAGTLTNLDRAMHDESRAYATYSLYARQATQQGRTALANLFNTIANEEMQHFREEANNYGLVRTPQENLAESMSAETSAIKTYSTFEADARKAGDATAAEQFADARKDETKHLGAFSQALETLKRG